MKTADTTNFQQVNDCDEYKYISQAYDKLPVQFHLFFVKNNGVIVCNMCCCFSLKSLVRK